MRKLLFAICISTSLLFVTACQNSGVKPPIETVNDSIVNWYHFIPKAKAHAMAVKFKELSAALIDGKEKFTSTLMGQAERFDSAQSMINLLMQQKNCTGIRVYYGVTDDNRIVPLICGVDAKGNDIYWHRKIVAKSTEKNLKAAQSLDGDNALDGEEGLLDMSQKEPPPIGSISLLP